MGIEAGRRLVGVYGETVVQHAPGVLACRTVFNGPVLARRLYAVFPNEVHGIQIGAVLRQLDGHLELGAHPDLFPQVFGLFPSGVIAWELVGQMVLELILEHIGQEHHAIDVFLLVVNILVCHIQTIGIAA